MVPLRSSWTIESGSGTGEDDLVDTRGAAPVVLVGHHADVLALVELDCLKRPRADDGRVVLKRVLGGVGLIFDQMC